MTGALVFGAFALVAWVIYFVNRHYENRHTHEFIPTSVHTDDRVRWASDQCVCKHFKDEHEDGIGPCQRYDQRTCLRFRPLATSSTDVTVVMWRCRTCPETRTEEHDGQIPARELFTAGQYSVYLTQLEMRRADELAQEELS